MHDNDKTAHQMSAESGQSMQDGGSFAADAPSDLSILLVNLLKGVQYREQDERQWARLLSLQPHVMDYVSVLGLELVLDEAEGYAFLKSRAQDGDTESGPKLPRLIARRPLSFQVSLLLALLRKQLLEFDAGGVDTRLVLSRDEIVEQVRLFMPDQSNEVRLIDQIEASINKVVELGFLHKLKSTSSQKQGPGHYEVRRILKAFVDAQWLSEFDVRLAAYQAALRGELIQQADGDQVREPDDE